ncbi:uncharacterized protein [Nicotiana tomentosiformis]|uniref:uncharacterized protein n=1 Tax=Nicotiana tomentosiformis TaxID=4098 RepID=UPI00388C40C6
MSVSLQSGIEISCIQSYSQGVKERKQKQSTDREHDRGQSKRAISSGFSNEFRGDQRQQNPSCGYLGHVMRDCSMRGGAGIVQPTGSVASSSSSELSPDVVTGILSVSSCDIYALIDPGSTLSYVNLLVASKFGIKPKLIEPFEVSTAFGDPVIARRVYRNCIAVDYYCSIVADLTELDMVDFGVIMGMDWLASYYANID